MVESTIAYSGNFSVQTPLPLDARTMVTNISDLTDPDAWKSKDGNRYLYKGLRVFVKAENCDYQLIAEPEADWVDNKITKKAFQNIVNWKKSGSEIGVTTSGTGNALSDVSFSNGTLTFTKDTFLPVKGDTGATGSTGTQGEVGPVGPTGPTGPRGLQGPTGAKGDTGDRGATGPQGSPGSAGGKGDKGDTGATGKGISSVLQTATSTTSGGTNAMTITYTDGSTSIFYVRNGAQGATGIQGSTGKGISGVSQTTTSTTSSGENIMTVTYTDGTTSTFKVKNGAVGAKGDTGAKGDPGSAGSPGAVGPTGATGPVGATGPQGPTGANGNPGSTGQRGGLWNYSSGGLSGTGSSLSWSSPDYKPSILGDWTLNTSNGNVYQCTVAGDTSTARWTYRGNIKGVKGDAGAKGDTGAAGATGPQGPTGSAGTPGSNGTRGGIWYYNTSNSSGDLVHKSGTGKWTNSGITAAIVGDMAINTATSNIYKCTTGGSASVAVWTYTGNIKGATGAKGDAGAKGATGPGIRAYVARDSFDTSAWNTYGTEGRQESWSNTLAADISNLQIGDLFVVYGNATDTGNSHQLIYEYDPSYSPTNKTLRGTCLSHIVINKGATGAAGSAGARGATGSIGPTGPGGSVGPTGPAGVSKNLVVKLNGGTTEGTNMFTYNGSAAKTVNITPSNIGAAASSHTHTIANITSLQTTLDGKAASSHTHTISQITSLQSTLDGKASTSHTHSYLPLSGGTLTNSLTISTGNITVSNGSVTAKGGFFDTSDARLKNIKNEIDLDKCLEVMEKCQTILYTLKDDDREQVGIIAQEIEQYFPEVVLTDEEGYKSVDYSRLTVLCMRVLRYVLDEIKDIKAKIS